MSSVQNTSFVKGRTLGPQLRRNDSAMSRPASPNPASRPDENAYSLGIYADPKPVKVMGLGPAVLQPAHTTLINRLRHECERLSGTARDLRERVMMAERRARTATDHAINVEHNLEQVVTELKTRNHDKATRIVQLTEELREAHQSLAEMDQLFSDTRNKRLSRIQARTAEAVGEARANLTQDQQLGEVI